MAYNLGTARGNITITYDSRGVAHARDDLGRFVSMSELMGDSVSRDTKKASRSFQLFGASVLKAAAITVAAAAAVNTMTSLIAGLVAVTQSFVPVITASLATLPGIILAAAVAFGTLKLALAGVADAMKAAVSQDLDKFNEAIKNLAPNAQQAAKAFYGLVAAFKPVQKALQDKVFASTAPLIAAISGQAVFLQHQFQSLGTAFNAVLVELLKFASTPEFIYALATSFQGLTEFIKALAPGIQPLLVGFSQLAAQAGKFFASFGDSAGQALRVFGEFLGSLDLDAMWQTAGTVLRNLGSLFSDLGSIVGSIVGAFTGAGAAMDDLGTSAAPLSNSLGELVGKISDFLSSAEGTQILGALAQAMSAVASAGGDVLLSLLSALAPIFAELGPLIQSLARAIGPILGAAFAALSPALTTVANALRTSLGPVLPSLVEAFTSLAPVISQIASVFGGVLGAALGLLVPVLARLAVILSGVLQQALTALLPYIQQWGQAFQEVATGVLPQLIPLLNQLGPLFARLIPFVTQAAIVFLSLLIPAMRLMGPVISVAIGYLNGMIGLWNLVISALIRVGSIFATVWNAVLSVTSVTWNLIRSAVQSASGAVTGAVTGMVSGVRGAISTLSSIPGQIGGYFRGAVSAVSGAVGALLGVVRGIPGQIRGALGNMAGLLVGAGRDVIAGFINGIRSMAGAAAAAARAAVAGVPGAIKGALGIGSPSKVTMALGVNTGEGLAIGILKTAGMVTRAMAEVANMVPGSIATGFEANAIANGAAYTNAAVGSQPTPATQVAAATPGAGIVVNQTVNALPGQSAKAVGDSAVQRLVFGVVTGTSGLSPAGAAA